MTFSHAFESIRRQHPTWTATDIAREMQRRSTESQHQRRNAAARRVKGRWDSARQINAAFWWQND